MHRMDFHGKPTFRCNRIIADFFRYWFYMNSVGVTQPGSSMSTVVTSSSYNQAMIADSGSTLCYLPPIIFKPLLAFFPGATSVGSGLYTISCSIRNQVGSIDFGFGSKIIHVSYNEFFWQTGSTCYFGAVESTQEFILGGEYTSNLFNNMH
jgi:hypothetical protein